MARETEDVMLWERLGLTTRRARAFCRWLDDEEPVGCSSVFIAHLVRQREDRVRMHFLAKCQEHREAIAALNLRISELESLLESCIKAGV